MTTINKTKKNLVEIVCEARQNRTFEFLSIDGIKLDGSHGAVCVLDYANEKDKQNAINFIQKVVDNSDKRGMQLVMEVAYAYQMAALHGEFGIPTNAATETVTIDDEEYTIVYEQSTIYNKDMTKEIANCKEYTNFPNEAIKAILIERVKKA